MNFIPLITTILVVIGNSFSSNNRTSRLGEFHQTNISPSGFTFSIWAIIYSGLIFVSYQYKKQFKSFQNVYILSGILNVLWLYVFQNCNQKLDQPHYHVVLSAIILIGIAITTTYIVSKLELNQVSIIFGIYSAWTIVASMLNIAIVTKEFNILSEKQIEYIILGVLTIAPYLLSQFKNKQSISKNLSYPLTWAWACLGIYTNEFNISNAILPLISNLVYSFLIQ